MVDSSLLSPKHLVHRTGYTYRTYHNCWLNIGTLVDYHIQSSLESYLLLQWLTKLKRRRGVSKASITRVCGRVEELEGLDASSSIIKTAKQLASKLESLDSEFKSNHFQIIDLLDEEDEEALKGEQDVLDGHDNQVAEMAIRINSLTTPTSTDGIATNARLLAHLHGYIKTKKEQIIRFDEDEKFEVSDLEQLQIQLSDHKSSL